MRLKKFDEGDYLFIFVMCLMGFGLLFQWTIEVIPLWVKLVISSLLILSMYYQFMVWHRQASMGMLGADIEETIVMEMAYHFNRLGDTVHVERISLNEDGSDYKIKWHHNGISRWRYYRVRLIAIIGVILNPAWKYREFEGDEDLWVE